MSETISSGVTITIPTLGEQNWDQTIRDNCFVPLSAHDHTGSGMGLQLGTNSLQASAVTTAKINDLAVTTGKINDAAVTVAKIGFAQTSYSPTTGANGSMTWTSITTYRANHMKMGALVHIDVALLGTVGGTPSTELSISLPYAAVDDGQIQTFPLVIRDNLHYQFGYGYITNGTSTLNIRKSSEAVWTANSGTGIWTNFTYITDE